MLCRHTREVVSPKRPDFILSADIPNVETGVLVRDGLDVEADGGNGVDFAGGAGRQLEGVQDSFRRMLSAAGSNDFCASFPSKQRQHETCAVRRNMPPIRLAEVDVLVFPAASRPSISRRISLLPKILARERESAAPMVQSWVAV